MISKIFQSTCLRLLTGVLKPYSNFINPTLFSLSVWCSWTSSIMNSSWGLLCQNTRRPSQPSAGVLTTQTCLLQPLQTTCSSYGTWQSKKLWQDWTTLKVDGQSTPGFIGPVELSVFDYCALSSSSGNVFMVPPLLPRCPYLRQLVLKLIRWSGICVSARPTLYLGLWRSWPWSDSA